MNTPIRLLLADDHAVMRSGLANMLGTEPQLTVVGEASDGARTLELFRKLRPDILLLDVTMPDMDGIETLRLLRKEFPQARAIMLSSSEADADVIHSFRSGACGYISKAAEPSELINAIKRVHAGEKVISPRIERKLAEQVDDGALSARELEVLHLIRKGMTNPDIARALNITRHTAKWHVAALLVKLGAADRTEAVARGFERGLLKP